MKHNQKCIETYMNRLLQKLSSYLNISARYAVEYGTPTVEPCSNKNLDGKRKTELDEATQYSAQAPVIVFVVNTRSPIFNKISRISRIFFLMNIVLNSTLKSVTSVPTYSIVLEASNPGVYGKLGNR